ncbi:MAG: IclR family transcriptional regulator [Pseudolabrys sp.]|nr:IclR family transcriptional regulator [Pseudolabrys sp.]
MKDSKGIVARVVGILGAFADGEPALAISQLSERLNMPPSSVHRLLEQLIALEVIERANHRRYRIGAEFFRIGVRVESKFRIVGTARPLMQMLADQLDETCVLSVLMRAQRQRLRVARVDSVRQPLKFKMQLLERHSLVWGAAGRAILAHMEPSNVERAFKEAPIHSTTGKPLPSMSRLMKDLMKVREDGFAFARGEFVSEDTVGVAAPLFGAGGKILGELCIVLPAYRFDEGMLKPISTSLIRATEQLSGLMGAAKRPVGSQHSNNKSDISTAARRRAHSRSGGVGSRMHGANHKRASRVVLSTD